MKTRPEIDKFEDTLDYLGGTGHIVTKDSKRHNLVTRLKVKGKGFISQKSRLLLGKLRNNHKDVKSWDSEYLEFILYKIVFALLKPFPPIKSALAQELGISLRVLRNLINTPQYLEIKKGLRKELRDKWGAEIDQMVIRRALKGSETAAKLFYDLQGELIQKLEVTKKDDIPQDIHERNKLIERLIKETGYKTSTSSGKKGK
jgi:hypothetical protein